MIQLLAGAESIEHRLEYSRPKASPLCIRVLAESFTFRWRACWTWKRRKPD